MPGISIHVVDVSRGAVAAGMAVALYAIGEGGGTKLIAVGKTSNKGLLEDPALDATFPAGAYRVLFHVADYYRDQRVAVPMIPFLNVVAYDFGISDPAQHYHLPFKCTPWGYSCFRGGS